MKLQTQILTFGLAGALLAALAGGIGLIASSNLGSSIDEAISAGQALQSSQEADMMHDAVRGDAQLALLGALEKKPELIADAAKGLKGHAQTFDASLTRLQSMHLSPQSALALTAAQPVVKRYIAVAEKVIQSAGADIEAGLQAMPELQITFSELEDKLATLSDSVRTQGEQLNTRAKERVDQTRLSIGVSVLFATSVMLVAALWLARRMVRPMAQAVAAADRLAQGDLSAEIQPEGNDETLRLLQALVRMRTSLGDIVRQVKANADEVSTSSAQIAQGNQDLSTRTEQQAGSLERAAASMEELSTTVRQNADNAMQANQLAQSASAVAQEGGDVVAQVVHTMKEINDSSKKIADIISVIDSIAFQTNILALNAAVEAARAGEQGRGFAVVASEVRSLARRSAEAAKEIKSLINASVDRVERGTELVDKAGTTMNEVVGAIKRVTDIMAEISAASAEQSAGVAQVSEAVTNMDQSTQQNAALVEQSAAAAESLKQQALRLVQAVAVFRLTSEATGTTAPSPLTSVSDRRGPQRAKNVVRPDFGATRTAGEEGTAVPPTADEAPRKRGTDNEWTSF